MKRLGDVQDRLLVKAAGFGELLGERLAVQQLMSAHVLGPEARKVGVGETEGSLDGHVGIACSREHGETALTCRSKPSILSVRSRPLWRSLVESKSRRSMRTSPCQLLVSITQTPLGPIAMWSMSPRRLADHVDLHKLKYASYGGAGVKG
jgi:hypothetical protein